MDAVLSGTLTIPLKLLPKGVREELTLRLDDLGASPGADPVEYVACHAKRRVIQLPRQYGLGLADEQGWDVEDRTSLGYALPKLKSIALRDYQKPWVDQMVEAADAYHDFRAQAHTGSGKTVMSLEVARRLGATAIVLVDQQNLMAQWVDAIQQHLKLKPSQIGCIQGNTLDFEKPFVIAMIQTLFSRELPPEVYEYYGTMIVDECHVVGAPVFSSVLRMFPATTRFGISATPNRRDSLQKVIEWNLGHVAVELKEQHKKSKVRVLTSDTVYSWYANSAKTTGRYVNEIAEDAKRNLLLATAIQRLYDQGRTILALSDRIEHLEGLFALCALRGIPEMHMGVYTRYQSEWRFAKDKTPKRTPVGWDKKSEYVPVALQMMRRKVKQEELEDIAATRQIIFATYSMFSKGVDVPRLDTGIDCIPRRTFEQVHGRILRMEEGKRVPLWVTIRDVMSFRAESQLAARLDEFSNVEVSLWHLQKGTKQQDLKTLKREAQRNSKRLRGAKIITARDGINMLLMKSTENSRRPERAATIGLR